MKINIQRLFDTGKARATEAGQQLSDFINFCSQAFENIIRALSNGLTFRDNFDCNVVNLTLNHNTEQIVGISKAGSQVTAVRVDSTFSSEAGLELVTGFGWTVNSNNQLVVKAKFDSAVSSRKISCRLTVLY